MTTASEGSRPRDRAAEAEGARDRRPEPGRKQIYLRTVYALNPGIPHFVDVPGGWHG